MTLYELPGASFEATLDNAPTGLVGTIGVRIIDDAGGTTLARSTAGIIETPAGSGHYAATLVAPALLGVYSVLWDSDPGGVASPTNSASDRLVIVGTLSSSPVIPPTPAGIPTSGPCVLWVEPDDLNCDPEPSEEQATEAATIASMLLYEATGRQFSGTCVDVIRPCSRGGCGWWGRWNGGAWRYPTCGCGSESIIELPEYPATGVLSVTIDGVELDEAAYRIDDYHRLVRIDGERWPGCQDMTAAAGAEGSFVIAYTHGQPPPVPGVAAARALACELVGAMTGGACALPAHVTRVVRQGVTIELGSLGELGDTGVFLVDSFVRTYNPNGLQRRPGVWSPDSHPSPRRRTF